MAFPKGMGSAAVIGSVLGFLAVMQYGIATDHIVGGNRGWQVPADAGPDVNLNYTEWAAKQKFVLGDIISFHYVEGQHSVYQVNYSTYVNCTTNVYYGSNWIYNWSNKGGRVVILLNETMTYYFVCGYGNHCQQGMKVAVNVTKLEANSTSAKSKHSSSDATPLFVTGMLLVGAFLYTSLSLLL